ncbi:helix-turn-helix domain-containing protein, partial [Patescibacteria group bacterium AH-259-L07]|nr:helix-turn-helix domain-containing protein [Patescibacteria group bacterium AH-259-L07]
KEFKDKDLHQSETPAAEKGRDRRELHRRTESAAANVKAYYAGRLENKVGIIETLLREDETEKAYEVLKELEKEIEMLHKEKMRHPHESEEEVLRHTVGYQIAHSRRKRRVSRADLAQKVERLSEDDIAKIEQGERDVTIDELEEIAKALDGGLKVELVLHYSYKY